MSTDVDFSSDVGKCWAGDDIPCKTAIDRGTRVTQEQKGGGVNAKREREEQEAYHGNAGFVELFLLVKSIYREW